MPFELDTFSLRSFIAIAETGHFGRAAEAMGRTQSALSLQIKKLETDLGCPLFTRSARKVALTEQGEIFLSYARRMLALKREAYSRLREADVRGEIRLGVPEDIATHQLPGILASFRKSHPLVQLNVQCELTLTLIERFNRGEFDLVLAKRDPARVTAGIQVWREPLVWAAADGWEPSKSLPLVLSPPPCIYRARALAALDAAGKAWNIAYTSPSLAGTLAAVKAGFGITVLPRNMLAEGIHAVREVRLPALADAEIALIQRDDLSEAGEMFARHIIEGLERGNA